MNDNVLWVLPNGDTIIKFALETQFGDSTYVLQPKILRPGAEIVELVRKSQLDESLDRIAVMEWLLAEARWVAAEPTVIHHHDIEKHAEHFNEGYEAATRQATEPLPGYDEPDATDPAHIRFAADVVERVGVLASATKHAPEELRLIADRIATRNLVEDITAAWADLPPHPSDLDRAAMLVSQFDITPKAGA